MDPISSLVIGHAAGKLIDRATASFRENVIERWSKRRARHFFEEFCREVELEMNGSESEKLDSLLDKMLKGEHSTELLFDAYRRVSLSRSKNIGPRVIGIITARLALAESDPTLEDEAVLDAAERLYDSELIEFSSFIQQYRKRAESSNDKDVSIDNLGALRIRWHVEQIDSNSSIESDVSLATLRLDEAIGVWARKLESLGIIQADMTERMWKYSEDSERHIDQDGAMREITWWILTWDKYFGFADLIARVSPVVDKSTQQTDSD